MIVYTDSLDNVLPAHLKGFFVGWVHPVSSENHFRILQGSTHIVLALDDSTRAVVGFVNALSDGFHAAFIPNLEVLPAYQGQGIGTRLMQTMLEKLADNYAIDLMCDPHVQLFYERLGMRHSTGMVVRNYDRQGRE